MNYYEHHIGDYAEATAHLSFVEDAAYSRLIRKYYAIEGPLPADLRAVQRLICARTEDEREAVEIVLGEFFTLQDDGYHNARCDEEIARYLEKQDKARRSANARWNKGKQHSDGDAGDGNAALPPQSERNANASKPTQPSNANASTDTCGRIKSECEGNAHQSPDTNTQSVDCYERERTHAGIAVPPDLHPDRSTTSTASSLTVDLALETAKFIAHHEAAGTVLADAKAWQSKLRKWVLDAHQYNADRNRVTESRMQTTQSRQDAIANACDTLGVGSQYLSQEPTHALR